MKTIIAAGRYRMRSRDVLRQGIGRPLTRRMALGVAAAGCTAKKY
jgi:hypothetical protein